MFQLQSPTCWCKSMSMMAALILIRFITLAGATPILTINRFRESTNCKIVNCKISKLKQKHKQLNFKNVKQLVIVTA